MNADSFLPLLLMKTRRHSREVSFRSEPGEGSKKSVKGLLPLAGYAGGGYYGATALKNFRVPTFPNFTHFFYSGVLDRGCSLRKNEPPPPPQETFVLRTIVKVAFFGKKKLVFRIYFFPTRLSLEGGVARDLTPGPRGVFPSEELWEGPVVNIVRVPSHEWGISSYTQEKIKKISRANHLSLWRKALPSHHFANPPKNFQNKVHRFNAVSCGSVCSFLGLRVVLYWFPLHPPPATFPLRLKPAIKRNA